MTRALFPTDLTDAQWAVVVPLLPPALAGGRPRDVDLREVLNAARYRHVGGCSWRLLPHAFPPWQTVYTYGRHWQHDGTWTRLLAALGDLGAQRTRDRESATDGTSSPRAAGAGGGLARDLESLQVAG